MKTLEIQAGPETAVVSCEKGSLLFEALVRAGILLRSDCGGKGLCGKCAVRLTAEGKESVAAGEDDRAYFTQTEIDAGYRLACRHVVKNDLLVEVPESSLAPREVIAKAPVDDLIAARLGRDFQADDADRSWGIAVDLGTTTIAVYLCRLDSGKVVGSVSCRNPQSIFGEDVVTRITAVRQDAGSLVRMQAMAVRAIEWGAGGLCEKYGAAVDQIHRMVAVGNSTMIHILLGENPEGIGVFPYHPLFTESRTTSAGSLGFERFARARVETLPLIAGFLGADIVAAGLAVGLPNCADGSLLVDLGTNGELMMIADGKLYATSCATGPALEGATIKHGMQAVSGAIDAVRIDLETGEPVLSVIPSDGKSAVKPDGICGSGVVSVVAELLRSRLLHSDGRFGGDGNRQRLATGSDGVAEYVLTPGTGQEISLTQKDVRAIQLAKGALRAGIDFLCRAAGLEKPAKIFLAGAFGTYIRREDVLTLGMFPAVSLEDIRAVGNAAGAGAVLALLVPGCFREAERIARHTEVIDLASQPGFQTAFVESLQFPRIARLPGFRPSASLPPE